jgi:hypothetical protein
LCTRGGGCEFDLYRSEVDYYLNRDSSPLSATLAGFNISSYEFQEELRRLKLYEKACWLNLVSLDTLESIAASMNSILHSYLCAFHGFK